MNEVKQLENSIRYYAEKYYLGSPVISDETFDALVDKLRKLNPNSYVLTTGWGFTVKGNKMKHKYSHVGSLDKCKTYEEIPDNFKNEKVYISPKLDGLSAVAYYENGILVKGLTRGNGEYGRDITDKLKLIIGDEINDKTFTGSVRGELIINENNWKELQGKYNDLIASRNFAAGIINRKDIDEDIKYIDFVVYKILGNESNTIYNTREQILQWLQRNFKTVIPIYFYPILNKLIWEKFHEETFKAFKELGYGLDGLVLTDDKVVYDGINKTYIYTEVAFKFQAETAIANVIDMEWTLSRTQRLVPVAVIEPTELSGAIVQRATGNNAKMVLETGLGKGAVIEIQRSGEVIPKILSVLETTTEELPILCPICHKQLVWDGVDLKCNNESCFNIDESDLQQWCESIGETDGLQWTLMKQYLDRFNIHSISSLYRNKENICQDLTCRQLSITELKIKEFIWKLFFDEVAVEKALVGLNIPRLGEKTSKLLAPHRALIKDYSLYCSRKNIGIENEIELQEYTKRFLDIVKEATTQELLNNKKRFARIHNLLDNEGESRLRFPELKREDVKVQYVAVTGSLNTMKRKDFEEYIGKYGYEISSNLKKCIYLITNTPDSGSTKNKQARQYGTQIITENEFLNNINK